MNVNFWITEDDASLDEVDADKVVEIEGTRAVDLERPNPQGGGLIVYQGTRGEDVKHSGYKINDNNPESQAKLRNYLREESYLRIPFRQNRMVFFNSGGQS